MCLCCFSVSTLIFLLFSHRAIAFPILSPTLLHFCCFSCTYFLVNTSTSFCFSSNSFLQLPKQSSISGRLKHNFSLQVEKSKKYVEGLVHFLTRKYTEFSGYSSPSYCNSTLFRSTRSQNSCPYPFLCPFPSGLPQRQTNTYPSD